MKLVYRRGQIEIWQIAEAYGFDFYVYGLYASGDPRVCPSLAMALEVAGA